METQQANLDLSVTMRERFKKLSNWLKSRHDDAKTTATRMAKFNYLPDDRILDTRQKKLACIWPDIIECIENPQQSRLEVVLGQQSSIALSELCHATSWIDANDSAVHVEEFAASESQVAQRLRVIFTGVQYDEAALN